MKEIEIDIKEIESDFRDVLSRLEPDTLFVIKDGDSYVGQILMYDRPQDQPRRMLGLHRGAVLYMADDFDAPLPDEFWLGGDP